MNTAREGAIGACSNAGIVLRKWVFAASLVGVALAADAVAPGSAAAETFDCVMEPSLVVELGGPVPGLLASVLVKRGDRVVRNQVVAKLNSKVEEATVKLLAEKANNSAEVDAQKARVDLAVSQAERVRKLAERDIASKQKLEEAVSQKKVAERELALAEMRRRVAQLELDRAKTTLDQRAIRSPIDGVVTVRNLYGGEYLDQNGKVATIAQLDPLNVETYLPVAFFGRVNVGMDVKVIPEPPFEGSYVGTVSVVDRVFDAASGTFGVRVNLPNADLQLSAGQRCKASFFDLSN